MDELYTTDYGAEPSTAELSELLSRIDRLDRAFHKARKKKKNGKGGKKKMKRHLKALKAEQTQIKNCIQALAYAIQQSQMQQKSSWWQGAVASTLPKLFDMGSIVLGNVTRKSPQLLTEKNLEQLLLTDSSRKR